VQLLDCISNRFAKCRKFAKNIYMYWEDPKKFLFVNQIYPYHMAKCVWACVHLFTFITLKFAEIF